MREILVLAVVLGYLYPLCSGQVIRPGCNLNNCSRSNVEICATNGQQCRRFSNECSLVSVNCNATLSTAWNRTDAIQCLNLRANATGSCACPSLTTCSNQTTAAGICTHRDGHACRLFRTECDLARARCNREIWRNIDIMQCRGFSYNQIRTCTCPKSLLCSRNATQLCVQVNRNTCRLYNNECDLEGDRCRGARLLDVNNIHCRRFSLGLDRSCACPLLMTCQRNVTNVCVSTANNRCQLIGNMCDLEQQRCQGNVQCRDISVGQTGNCACPGLTSCSLNRTNICVRTRVGCRLKTNECELERARCLGEVAVPVSPLQCRGFLPGDGRACACPALETCNRNNRTICVRSDQGCMLLRNDCQLAEARCQGQNLTVVDHIQCHNFSFNQLRNCSCPNAGICTANATSVCVTTSTNQCRLLRNICEVEMARCRGETLTLTHHPVQCRGLMLNSNGDCFCPRLGNCSRNSTSICVREVNNATSTCLLVRNECEFEQAMCEGRNFTRVEGVYCRNFPPNENRTCSCSSLETCNRSSSAICVIHSTQCRLMGNECEVEQAKCAGNNLITTHAAQCLNFRINQQSNCSCPNLLTCSQNSTTACVSTRAGCKLLTTQCEYEEALCRGEVLGTEDSIHCQGFQDYEERSCSCPKLKTCSRNSTSLCVRNENSNCTLLQNECDFERSKCQGQDVRVVAALHCLNFTLAKPATCVCSNLFNCSSTATNICIQTTSGCKLLRNQCEVEHEKCQRSVQITSPLNCLGLTYGQLGNCSCPNLTTCSRNKTNICVKTNTGCRLVENECELERLRCKGNKLSILPPIQCRLLESGIEGACACPDWIRCRHNSNKVCVETAKGCKLLKNQCHLEQRKCHGYALNVTDILQCQGFRTGELRNCACPELKTCSRDASTRICMRNRGTCKLMANSCENELAKCKREKWCTANIEECRDLAVGQQSKCSCPKLQTCSLSRAVNICAQLKGACKLMRTQCDFERAKCKGKAWTPTNAIQCRNYRPNEWRWCACPRLFNCCNKRSPFCVRGPSGCKLMETDCELQLARCRGEVWTRTDDLQCLSFKLGENAKSCTCPKLKTCQKQSPSSPGTEICVRSEKGCTLLSNSCELERSLCRGEAWQPVNNLQCLNFPLHHTRSCHCPNLDNCTNTTSVCARGVQNQCYNFKTECDMRWSQCKGKALTLTSSKRCQGIGFDEHSECKCPKSRNCNRSRAICAHKNGQCKLFRNYCDFRKSYCRDENWKRIAASHCCRFRVNEVKMCTRNMSSLVCAQNDNGMCHLFATRCGFKTAQETKSWLEVHRSKCKCLRNGVTGRCAKHVGCRPASSPNLRVCGSHRSTYRLFASRCHLRQHNYQTCSNFREVRISRCHRT